LLNLHSSSSPSDFCNALTQRDLTEFCPICGTRDLTFIPSGIRHFSEAFFLLPPSFYGYFVQATYVWQSTLTAVDPLTVDPNRAHREILKSTLKPPKSRLSNLE
jgi:hypothetical protein